MFTLSQNPPPLFSMYPCRDVEIFFDMPVIWTDFENFVSPNN